ncbi:phage tail protein [Acidisoma sp. 7E03]
MATPFVGEIRIFGGFTGLPSRWALCDGRALQVAGNEILFSLIGTTYGGDGRTTFNLPNLSGRLPIGAGQGPQLTNYSVAASGGTEEVTLTVATLPPHTHAMFASSKSANLSTPSMSSSMFAKLAAPSVLYDDMSKKSGADANFGTVAIQNTGSSIPHPNIMPTMALRYMIALSGIYPSFS